MSSPGIELRWGCGFQFKNRREWMRPVAKTAISVVQQELEDIGVSWQQPKRVIIHQMVPNNRCYGEANGNTAHVLITPSERRRRRVDMAYFTGTMFHEVLHSIHFENKAMAEAGMMQVAVAEGVAYVADYDVVTSLLRQAGRKGPRTRLIEQFTASPPAQLRAMEGDFLEDAFASDVLSESNYSKWFSKCVRPYKVTMGELVGISAVSRLVEQGWDVADLIKTPPEVVLAAA